MAPEDEPLDEHGECKFEIDRLNEELKKARNEISPKLQSDILQLALELEHANAKSANFEQALLEIATPDFNKDATTIARDALRKYGKYE